MVLEEFFEILNDNQCVLVYVKSPYVVIWNRSVTFRIFLSYDDLFKEVYVFTSSVEFDNFEQAEATARAYLANNEDFK